MWTAGESGPLPGYRCAASLGHGLRADRAGAIDAVQPGADGGALGARRRSADPRRPDRLGSAAARRPATAGSSPYIAAPLLMLQECIGSPVPAEVLRGSGRDGSANTPWSSSRRAPAAMAHGFPNSSRRGASLAAARAMRVARAHPYPAPAQRISCGPQAVRRARLKPKEEMTGLRCPPAPRRSRGCGSTSRSTCIRRGATPI